LRARGLSFRAIGAELGIHHCTAWQHYIQVADYDEQIPAELAKEQLLAAHAELIGKLMADLDQQAAMGQVEEVRGADGQLLNSKIRRWISPATAAEAGRALQRVAVLMGLTEVNPDQGNGSSSTAQTTINLVSPAATGAEFQLRAEQLKDAAIDISSTSASAETPPEVPEPLPAVVDLEPLPTAPTAAPEPIRRSMRTVADRQAARAARKAAAGG
jgi:hypothetical protein